MDKMIYTAAQGASRILQSQAIRANNLANADTQAFVPIWSGLLRFLCLRPREALLRGSCRRPRMSVSTVAMER